MTMASAARRDGAALSGGRDRRLIDALLPRARLSAAERAATEALARDLVQRVRAQRRRGGLDAFLHQYALTTEEGVVLMCLAEALLRVPDAETADKLIKDKIGSAQLGEASRAVVVAVRQRVDVGADADRARREARRRRAGLDARSSGASCSAAASRSSVRR